MTSTETLSKTKKHFCALDLRAELASWHKGRPGATSPVNPLSPVDPQGSSKALTMSETSLGGRQRQGRGLTEQQGS